MICLLNKRELQADKIFNMINPCTINFTVYTDSTLYENPVQLITFSKRHHDEKTD